MYIVYDQFFSKLEIVKNIKMNDDSGIKIDIVQDLKGRGNFCLFQYETQSEQVFSEVPLNMHKLKNDINQISRDLMVNIQNWTYKLLLKNKRRNIFVIYFLTDCFEFYWKGILCKYWIDIRDNKCQSIVLDYQIRVLYWVLMYFRLAGT